MSLITIGINHKTAPIKIRERVAFGPELLPQALQDLVSVSGVDEAAILSTCNRTELYCHLQEPDHNIQVVQWLGEYHHLREPELEPYLYQHLDQSAVRHTLRVASGLDSMILGEPQILGQLKSAYQHAHLAGTLGRLLSRLFQHAFAAAKQVRTDTAIGSSPVSVAFAAVDLARQIFDKLNQHHALMIGAGETIELACRHFKAQGVQQLSIANRNIERAKAIAKKFDAQAYKLEDLAELLPNIDIIVASTASSTPILGKGTVESALRKRKHRPILIVDIAVPRDVEPEVKFLNDVYLYNIDDLRNAIAANLRTREEAADQANEIIEVQVEEFMGWMRGQDAVGPIRSYRERARQEQNKALKKAKRMLEQGHSPEEALEYLAHTLTNKLAHEPTKALNQAARDGQKELIEAARILLNLYDDSTDE